MPAHCKDDYINVKKMGDGTYLQGIDLRGNELSDIHAKDIARRDQVPDVQRDRVKDVSLWLCAIAQWIAQATLLANHWEILPDAGQPGPPKGGLAEVDAGVAGFGPTWAQTPLGFLQGQ